MTTTDERLQELLDRKDEQIDELEGKLSDAENRAEANWTWTAHDKTDKDPFPDLPVPRLEMRWVDLRDENGRFRDYPTMVRYDLVYRFYTAAEGSDEVIRVPIGGTRTSATIEDEQKRSAAIGLIDLPFRDGCHIMHDMTHFGLPAFAILGGHIERLTETSRLPNYQQAVSLGVTHRTGHTS